MKYLAEETGKRNVLPPDSFFPAQRAMLRWQIRKRRLNEFRHSVSRPRSASHCPKPDDRHGNPAAHSLENLEPHRVRCYRRLTIGIATTRKSEKRWSSGANG